MKTPIIWKIYEKIIKIIKFFTGHTYGCCDNIFKKCNNCKYVICSTERNCNICREKYDFPYSYCCLYECGLHKFCRKCTKNRVNKRRK